MSVKDLKRTMMGKVADAPKTNEDDTNKSVGNVYEPPPGRAPETIDAQWGDKPKEGPDGYPVNYGTGTRREARNGRNEMLERLFDQLGPSATAQQAEMKQLFENAGEGHPHSPVLQRGHTDKLAQAEDESLLDKVVRVCGRP